MFGWDDATNNAQEVYGEGRYENQEKHKGKFSHEVLAGAAAFEGFKLYEDHKRNEGDVIKHKFAKEALAGFVGAELDKLAETHGMDEWDKRKTREQAQERSHDLYDQHYGNAPEYDPNNYGPPRHLERRDWGNDRREDDRRGDDRREDDY